MARIEAFQAFDLGSNPSRCILLKNACSNQSSIAYFITKIKMLVRLVRTWHILFENMLVRTNRALHIKKDTCSNLFGLGISHSQTFHPIRKEAKLVIIRFVRYLNWTTSKVWMSSKKGENG